MTYKKPSFDREFENTLLYIPSPLGNTLCRSCILSDPSKPTVNRILYFLFKDDIFSFSNTQLVIAVNLSKVQE